ncbi:DUF2934 domain-containing protein [uncultured Aureimonas sp.]|uniref:DUF2934 domain-containing protein n=1 Tax=uncultured Aureimonas sp. TaxID=1604662 RepID=UPI0025CF8975|nr:DUF2934 domain-containing protein [uncultured Aureimonas sp.]
MLNLYRRHGEVPAICAVPDNHALPDFLSVDGWVLAGRTPDISDQLPEPDRLTHQAVLAETGFYVFTPVQAFDGNIALADRPRQPSTDEIVEDDHQMDLEPLVKERAYFLWEAAGCPLGREHEFWAAASREIEADVRARLERRHAGRHVAR